MVTLYVASSELYSGKTLACLVLGMRWQRQGRRVGYMKPLGMLPVAMGDQVTDEDAQFVAQHLNLEASPSHLCPVLLVEESCHLEPEDARRQVAQAFTATSRGMDVMLVGGSGSLLSGGSVLGLDGASVAEMLDAKVLLVTRCLSFLDVDSIIAAHRALDDRLLGVILNLVPPREEARVREHVVPCLERDGMTVLGLLPMDPVLHSVSIRELVEATGGRLLCGADAADEIVENFVVGAMGVDRALHYFRRTPRKCVITGGDRSDIQLAALETPTRCLILTGDLQPRHTVLARAKELGVPVLLVPDDTLHTVSTIDEMLGRLRVREPKKISRAAERFDEHLDLAKLDALLGLT
ncbi:MAG: phosphotransacetylase family protein [Armatimonadota bacterium]|nr:MAG: phosphotransacetylase family protein [Armatimonadota bacterium]